MLSRCYVGHLNDFHGAILTVFRVGCTSFVACPHPVCLLPSLPIAVNKGSESGSYVYFERNHGTLG